MSKPIIGITVSQHGRKSGDFSNYIPSAYPLAVRNAGGIPLLIPIEYPLEDIELLHDSIAGILLSGGGDINSTLYNQLQGNDSLDISNARDALEFALVSYAIKNDLPLLGICRGHQMLNVALGGTLFTDIPKQYVSPIEHNTSEKDACTHDVSLLPGTGLAKISNVDLLRVNSRHHQAVKDLAPGLVVTAHASDGLIEGIELPGHRFCMGVQWHPENLQYIPEHQKLVASFVSAAGR